MFRHNSLKARIAAGETVFGAWVGSGHPGNAEVLSHIGFDFLVIDQEHGQGDLSSTATSVLLAEAHTPCVVRVPEANALYLKQALDRGITGFMVPSVTGPEMARQMVAATRYPPDGTRGYAAAVVRGSRFGMEPGYLEKANANTLLMAQIESADAVERIPEMAAIEGVDVLFIGPNDLAGSIGRLEQLDHPEVVALLERAEQLIRQSGKPMGTIPSAARSLEETLALGYTVLVGPHDVALLRDGARQALAGYRALATGKTEGGKVSGY